MRTYFLRLTESDFTQVDNVWSSGVIDLFDNDSYRNFSATKSQYGLNLLEDNTWTGMELLAPAETDTGFVESGRYIDTSGRIDLVSYVVLDIGTGGTAQAMDVSLDLYTSEDEAAAEDEWAITEGLKVAGAIELEGVFRYSKFVLTFIPEATTVTDFEFLVRVEIGVPQMAPLYRRTRTVLDKFPSWMAIRELENVPDDPNMATPSSTGGAFLNAAAGEWLDELLEDLTYLELQRFIDSVDLNQVAWVYKTVGVPQYLYSVKGDGVELARAYSLEEFYDANDDDVCWWDEETRTLYVAQNYSAMEINGAEWPVGISDATPTRTPLEPHHVWNWLDDIGLFVDLRRLQLETNERFRWRILDVHLNRPGAGLLNFRNALRRELDIWRVYGLNPEAATPGATPSTLELSTPAHPEILEMSDIELDTQYIQPDGMPTEKFIRLVDVLSRQYPTTWGRFVFDKAMWDVGGLKHEGFGQLPYRLDATPLTHDDSQYGVGDAGDLFVHPPSGLVGLHDFTAQLKLRGRQRVPRDEYRKVTFNMGVYGRYETEDWDNPPITVPFTLELAIYTPDASPAEDIWVRTFEVTAESNASPGMANTVTTEKQIFDDNFALGSFINKVDGTPYGDATPTDIAIGDVQSITLVHGSWDVDAQDYLGEIAESFEAWFSHDPGITLDAVSSPISIEAGATPAFAAAVIVRSDEVDPSPATVYGYTEEQITSIAVEVNGGLPDQSPVPFSFDFPFIVWPDDIITGAKEYIIELFDSDEGVYGAVVPDTPSELNENQPIFLDDTYIEVDGDSTWSTNIKVFPDSTTTAEITIADGALYPIAGETWELFEVDQLTPFSGIVDENGPWRSDQPPNAGRLINFTLAKMNVTRADFGIPETTDYLLTWMGVEVLDDPHVLTWLDSNSIQPAVTTDLDIDYPAGAIVEELGAGVYSFSEFVVRARLRPEPVPQWYPQVNAGWYYRGDEEYYLYVKPEEELVSGSTPILEDVARQGAPIIVHTDEENPREFRQVFFFDDASTPTALTLTNTEVVNGNGTTTLYLAYPDVYNVAVEDLNTGLDVTVSTSSETNEITVSEVTPRETTYEVTYRLNRSFYADNAYEDLSATPYGLRTQLAFSQIPEDFGVDNFKVTYETSIFHPATPVDLPLSPLYTTFTEGFIFVSHNEYTLDQVTVRVSPSKVVADGEDYLLVTLKSVDQYGNPKGNQEFDLSTTWGVLDETQLETDRDGFAVAKLTSAATTNTLTGVITITGSVSATVKFEITPVRAPAYKLSAAPSTDMIPADGVSLNYVFGRVQDPDFAPVPYANVRWRRARNLQDAFIADLSEENMGTSVTDAEGIFTVGPFESATPGDPGYWYLVVESDDASPPVISYEEVGDVVFWHEYPESLYGIENLSGLPRMALQSATPPIAATPYSDSPEHPAGWSETDPELAATPAVINWLPPKWYALDLYEQYQLGLFGATPGALDYDEFTNLHPHKRDF